MSENNSVGPDPAGRRQRNGFEADTLTAFERLGEPTVRRLQAQKLLDKRRGEIARTWLCQLDATRGAAPAKPS